MGINRQHGITCDTYKHIVIDSGAVYKNYGLANEELLGATTGGNTFTVEREYFESEVDGARGKVKGAKRIINVSASITANFIEIQSNLLLKALPGSVSADYPVAPATATHDSITAALAIEDSSYWDNIAIVGEVTGNDASPLVLILTNAIADGGFELGLTDKADAVLAVTFSATFDPCSLDDEPWEIRNPKIA